MTAHTSSARRRTERSPLRTALSPLLVAVLVGGAGVAGAVLIAPEAARVHMAVAAGLAALTLCVAVGVIAYQRARHRELSERLEESGAEVWRLAHEALPELVSKVRAGSAPDSAYAAIQRPEIESHQVVLRTVAKELGHSEAGKAAAMSACADAAGRMQALATGMLADLRDMEHRHADEAVLADLLYLDHRTAQAGRLADSIAVLTGARSGRRWAKPIVMESILRGAMGRIAGYQRVRLHTTVDVSVAGHAAEGVMHALAELLDNAANFSPPTAEVHVYVEEVPAGLVVTIEDSGLVMSDFALRRAERSVSGQPLDLTTLSGTRLGLAVVGCLARKHGLTVSFRPSARGGTGVVVRVPQELVSRQHEAWPQAGAQQPASRYTPATQQPLEELQKDTQQELATASQSVWEPAQDNDPLFGPQPVSVPQPPVAPESPAGLAEQGLGPGVAAQEPPEEGTGGGFPLTLPQRRSRLRPATSDAWDASDEHARPSSAHMAGADQLYVDQHGGPAPAEQDHVAAERPEVASRQDFFTPAVAPRSAARFTPQEPSPYAEPGPYTEPAAYTAPGQPQDSGEQGDFGPSGLPKRRRGQTLAAAHRTAGASARPQTPRRSAAESAAQFGAFRRAVRGSSPHTDNVPGPGPESTPPASPSSHPEDDVR